MGSAELKLNRVWKSVEAGDSAEVQYFDLAAALSGELESAKANWRWAKQLNANSHTSLFVWLVRRLARLGGGDSDSRTSFGNDA